MDGFDSKDFYGHSLSHDPKLRTTTRNYEFKFNSSDHLERVISRVKMDREMRKQAGLINQNRMISSFGKLRVPLVGSQSTDKFNTPPVETQIGRTSSRETVVKIMSDEEIEAMISQAVHSQMSLPPTSEESELNIFHRSTGLEPKSSDVLPNTNAKSSLPIPFNKNNFPNLETKVPKFPVELASLQEPHWVEIKPTQKAVASTVDIRSTSRIEEEKESHDTAGPYQGLPSNENLDPEEMKLRRKPPDDQLSVLSAGSNMSLDYVLRGEEPARRKQEEDSPLDSPISFAIESPLNDCERAEMERVLGKVLPHVPEMAFDNLDSQDASESTEYDDSEDEDDVAREDASSFENIEQHVEPIVRIQQFGAPSEPQQPPAVESFHPSIPETGKSITSRSPRVDDLTASSKGRVPQTPMDKRMKKQIEVLKHEKIRIFSKMTSIQEKIIEILDRLRMSLLELSLPDGQVERKLRERNAFEFSVRFSRNYLFPLGRMIEELRLSPKEDYSSAVTNEPCVKVCGIYGLLSQALQCYHKQLRHFFTDNIPKKLDILLNMITETTNMCLQKKIFDKRDTLIQSLLLRAGIFLDFVMKFAEQKKHAQEEECTPKSGRRDHLRLSKTSSKWDLTMNLNNLNMYEPKLVPKKPKKKNVKKPMQAQSSRATIKSKTPSTKLPQVLLKDSDPVILPAPDDPVDTQVRQDPLQSSTTFVEETPEVELTKTVIETLQDITKDEVRQMLGPIVSNLDSIFRSPVSLTEYDQDPLTA